MKFLVITERGRVVGAQPVTPSSANAPASSVLVAGPGQKRHEVEVADPGDLATGNAIDAFHRKLADSLPSRKKQQSRPRGKSADAPQRGRTK